jgi:hypothetical protein
MKNSLFGLCLLAGVIAAPAGATVIGFESPYQSALDQIDYPIAGFTFNPTLHHIDLAYAWADAGPAHSGNFGALNNMSGAGEIKLATGGTFSFQSLWVKNWYDETNRAGQVEGYRNGVVVASVSGTASGSWQEIVGNFEAIDKLRFNFGSYFLVDDIALNEAAADVPEPGSLALLGLGLALVGLFARKKRPTPHV